MLTQHFLLCLAGEKFSSLAFSKATGPYRTPGAEGLCVKFLVFHKCVSAMQPSFVRIRGFHTDDAASKFWCHARKNWTIFFMLIIGHHVKFVALVSKFWCQRHKCWCHTTWVKTPDGGLPKVWFGHCSWPTEFTHFTPSPSQGQSGAICRNRMCPTFAVPKSKQKFLLVLFKCRWLVPAQWIAFESPCAKLMLIVSVMAIRGGTCTCCDTFTEHVDQNALGGLPYYLPITLLDCKYKCYEKPFDECEGFDWVVNPPSPGLARCFLFANDPPTLKDAPGVTHYSRTPCGESWKPVCCNAVLTFCSYCTPWQQFWSHQKSIQTSFAACVMQ